MADQMRPRRSVLYMPGSNDRALEKAKSLPADSLILDLEDAVAPDAKPEARALVTQAVKAGGYGLREIVIRMNGLETQWGAEDLAAIIEANPDAVLVPKVSSVEDVVKIANRLEGTEIAIWSMIETPRAFLHAEEIALAHSRQQAWVMGTNDLVKETRAAHVPGRAPLTGALSLAVLAGRMGNLVLLDGVYNDIKNEQGFAAECEQGLQFGFDGKTLIHPSQLEPANRIFAPTEDEVAFACAIIAAFDEPDNQGKGVLKVEGKMVELLHRDQARRTVAMAEAIAARAEG